MPRGLSAWSVGGLLGTGGVCLTLTLLSDGGKYKNSEGGNSDFTKEKW